MIPPRYRVAAMTAAIVTVAKFAFLVALFDMQLLTEALARGLVA
jgi:hypothetical protein